MVIESVKPNIFFADCNKPKNAAVKSDEQILFEAEETALAKTKDNHIAKAQKALPYIMVGALSAGIGAKTPGTLSRKIMKGSQVIGFYAMMDVAFKAFYGAKDFIENKVKKDEPKKETKHPFLKTLATIGAGLLTLKLFSRGLFFGINKIIKNNPQAVKNTIGKIQKGLDSIDKTKLASKVEEFKPKYHNFESKHQKLVSKISNNILPITLISYCVSTIALAIKNNKKREDIFKDSVTKDVTMRKICSDTLR